MSRTKRQGGWKRHSGVATAAVILCLSLSAAPGLADETTTQSGTDTRTLAPAALDADRAWSPFTLAGEPDRAPDGDAVRLQLDQPITLQQFGEAVLGQRGTTRSTGAALNYRLDDALSLQGGMAIGERTGTFHALGSIHCQNGVLDAVSYRASNCTFVDDRAGSAARSIVLGASFDGGANTRASFNLFRDEADWSQPYRPGQLTADAAAFLDPFASGLLAGDPLLGGVAPLLAGYQAAETERTGVDLEFQVGFSTDQAGDLVLGLQLTRVLDSGTEGVSYPAAAANNWTIAKPYDTARLSLGWNRGPFSGGVDSYYRSPVSFLDQGNLDSQATFDVHFTWRAPWNASLSVGASNVLGAGAEESPANDSTLVDPFESIYGRIPYVRYKQDL